MLGLAGAADATTVAAATAVAARAQRGWAATPLVERVAVIRRAAALLERHRPEIEGWMVREAGAIAAKAAQRSPRPSPSSTRPRRSSRIRSG